MFEIYFFISHFFVRNKNKCLWQGLTQFNHVSDDEKDLNSFQLFSKFT